ncbi:MAG: bifunctional glutamate N-acetyltransferase/amino-acid acetyltransferase ArgJ [Candidatus Ratteibacteria bacterium]|nr:bifunctional glutamate N-acetyltransferase/amino-acid acetyltransferase ArgJ [Candidatus Ratteibacteria bacterium]
MKNTSQNSKGFIGGGITAPLGFKGAGVHCGIKKRKLDLAFIFSEVPSQAAGVFTTNKIAAPPVQLSREKINKGNFRAIIVNSGNANACTGKKGLEDAKETASFTALVLGIKQEEILVSSTGIIGRLLPMPQIKIGIGKLIHKLSKNAHRSIAEAMMTTDTFLKEAAWQTAIGGSRVQIGGAAKGAGMIFPNMATMLCFLTTDANISRNLLRKALREAVNNSFNSISVDGAQSTNDMVIILANGLARNKKIKKVNKDFLKFQEGLNLVAKILAQKIVEDGEGATKFVEIAVKGASNDKEAEKAAWAIAHSNLVKTSLFGADPNWGRIMAALGSSGVKLKEEQIDIYYGDCPVVKKGRAFNVSAARLARLLRNRKIKILVNLGICRGEKKFLTTDLSPDYIRINAGPKMRK